MDCACQMHRRIHQQVAKHQTVSAMDAATQAPQSSQANSSGDPSQNAAAVGLVAEQLMSLALQVVKGGHCLEALDVITICFEG
jgi:hypothetical protein